jgi:CcmD family protein
MDDLSYLLAAFIIIWVGLFIYIAVLACRQGRLRRDIDRLKSERQQPPERGGD